MYCGIVFLTDSKQKKNSLPPRYLLGAETVQGECRAGDHDGESQTIPRQRGPADHVLQMFHHQPAHQQQVFIVTKICQWEVLLDG